MILVIIEARMLTHPMIVNIAGRHYVVDHVSGSANVVYAELLPLFGAQRPLRLELHEKTHMEIYTPLM